MTVTYALLTNRNDADLAISELEALKSQNKSLHVHVLDHGAHADTIALHETGALRGALNGAAYGSVGAGAIVALFTLAGVIAAPFFPYFMAAVALGLFYGGFVGFVAGASCPDLNLERLDRERAKHEGAVIVSVASNNLTAFSNANEVLRQHGAIESHPQLF